MLGMTLGIKNKGVPNGATNTQGVDLRWKRVLIPNHISKTWDMVNGVLFWYPDAYLGEPGCKGLSRCCMGSKKTQFSSKLCDSEGGMGPNGMDGLLITVYSTWLNGPARMFWNSFVNHFVNFLYHSPAGATWAARDPNLEMWQGVSMLIKSVFSDVWYYGLSSSHVSLSLYPRCFEARKMRWAKMWTTQSGAETRIASKTCMPVVLRMIRIRTGTLVFETLQTAKVQGEIERCCNCFETQGLNVHRSHVACAVTWSRSYTLDLCVSSHDFHGWILTWVRCQNNRTPPLKRASFDLGSTNFIPSLTNRACKLVSTGIYKI